MIVRDYKRGVRVMRVYYSDGRNMKDTGFLHSCQGLISNSQGYDIYPRYLELLSSSQDILILLL